MPMRRPNSGVESTTRVSVSCSRISCGVPGRTDRDKPRVSSCPRTSRPISVPVLNDVVVGRIDQPSAFTKLDEIRLTSAA